MFCHSSWSTPTAPATSSSTTAWWRRASLTSFPSITHRWEKLLCVCCRWLQWCGSKVSVSGVGFGITCRYTWWSHSITHRWEKLWCMCWRWPQWCSSKVSVSGVGVGITCRYTWWSHSITHRWEKLCCMCCRWRSGVVVGCLSQMWGLGSPVTEGVTAST